MARGLLGARGHKPGEAAQEFEPEQEQQQEVEVAALRTDVKGASECQSYSGSR